MSLRQHKQQQEVSGLASWSDVLPPIEKRNPSPPTAGSDDDEIVPVKKASQAKHSKPRPKKPRRAIPENKDYLHEDEQPNQLDVVGGRGGRSNHNPGNRPYWWKILEARQAYKVCETDAGKCQIAQDILEFVKGRGGRFLNLEDSTKRWFLLPDSVVLDKVKQALRDKYVPYWAKNIEIRPLVVATTTTDARSLIPNMGIYTNQHETLFTNQPGASSMPAPSSMPPPANASNQKQQKPNNLDFLLAASRVAFGGVTGREVIPSVDDILKCKIDSLPAFDQRQRAAAALAATANGQYMSSLGMGNFHSVDFMPSLGGGSGSLATGNIGGNVVNTTTMSSLMGSLGGGYGGPFGGPMPGNFGATPTTTELGASLALKSLDYKSLDQFMDNQMYFARAGRSIDLMNSMASQGGYVSLGGLGGFQLPPIPAGRAGATDEGETSSTGLSSSAGGSNRGSKTDWNAMFAKAIHNPKPI